MKRKFTLKERLQYWFDNRMSGGSMGLLRLLLICSLLMILVITLIITGLHFNPEQDFGATLWESFATVINAWMPSSEDGPLSYLIMLSLAAVGGLFITSVLIGLISTAIEEKITSLRQGRSIILESGHVILLGFTPGECTLIRQLILSAAGKPEVIVVAADLDPEEMWQSITDNITIPDNIRLICRQADVHDAATLERLMITEARSVIISPQDDRNTIKTLLAVSNFIEKEEDCTVRVSAILSGVEHRLPAALMERHNVSAVQANIVLAKMIAHSCTQSGLSQAFQEIFNFEGSEFYLLDFPESYGITFLELIINMDAGVPAGILHDGTVMLNPAPETVIQEGDRILVFAENRYLPKLSPDRHKPEEIPSQPSDSLEAVPRSRKVTIIGYNKELKTVIRDLPEDVSEILLAGLDEAQQAKILSRFGGRRDLKITFFEESLEEEDSYLALAEQSDHIAILSDYSMEDDDADMEVIFHILNLRDIRSRFGLQFNITAELCLSSNEALISTSDGTDYIVSSSMSSLILAQLSESPELIKVFQEILSNEGNELFLRTAEELGCIGKQTIRSLRGILCRKRCILLGLLGGTAAAPESLFNPPLDQELDLKPEDQLIILCEQ